MAFSFEPIRARRVFIGVCVLALAVWGCSSVSSPPDRFYDLKVRTSDGGAGACHVPGVLVVNRPQADALIDELGLVYRPEEDSPQLRRHVYHLWADPPTLMIQSELAAYLKKRGVADTVVTPGLRARADYALNGNIAEMHRVLGEDPTIVLALDLNLVRLRDRKVLVQSAGVVTLPAPDVAAATQAYGVAATSLFDQFLATCQRDLAASK